MGPRLQNEILETKVQINFGDLRKILIFEDLHFKLKSISQKSQKSPKTPKIKNPKSRGLVGEILIFKNS